MTAYINLFSQCWFALWKLVHSVLQKKVKKLPKGKVQNEVLCYSDLPHSHFQNENKNFPLYKTISCENR